MLLMHAQPLSGPDAFFHYVYIPEQGGNQEHTQRTGNRGAYKGEKGHKHRTGNRVAKGNQGNEQRTWNRVK